MVESVPNPFGANDDKSPENSATEKGGLAAWVMAKVKHGRDIRRQKYADRWEEYTRLWRGIWIKKDKNTDSERSRLIAPALQQAVEMTVAEMEEAVFSREAWFDIEDDIEENAQEKIIAIRDRLLEDFSLDFVPDSISKVFLLGAIYGTGIAKINVQRKAQKTIIDGDVQNSVRVSVDIQPIRPDEFVIDPSALTIDEAEFVAHEMIRPLHLIKEKQKAGTYNRVSIGPYSGVKIDSSPDGTSSGKTVQHQDNAAWVTEYFGKVPGRFFGKGGMVEAVVTVGNEGVLLRAIESPFTMKDRPIVAYQHDTVPGEFWGRGVCEKGYNPQKALDAEIRARVDALALITAPMMGADITRLPRNPDMRVRPGKTVFTRGRPSEIYEPVSFGNPAILSSTFQQAGDLERMVQMGTGAMDSATPLSTSRRNETASGMSMQQSGFIKRSKRTMQNLERQFLDPLIKKSLWRYMQFDPKRYPYDAKFVVNATMGIMAKEVENSQLINMLGFVPPESPAHAVIMKAIFDNSASANKKELMTAIQQALAPPSEEEQQIRQLQQQMEIEMAKAQLEEQKLKNAKLVAERKLTEAKTVGELVDADLADDLVEIQAANAATAAEKTRVQRQQVEANKQKGDNNGKD